MRGTLTIARLTWLEARRRRIALAAVVCGLVFLAVVATAAYLAHRSVATGTVASFEARIMFRMLLQAGLYVVNFLVVACAVLLPVDTLSGEISSGVIQTLASKPIDRAAIVLGKCLTYWLMTGAYLLLMAGGVVLSVWLASGIAVPHLPAAFLLMWLGATVMLAVTILGGTRLTTIANGIVAFAVYGIAFVGGWVEQIATVLRNDAVRYVGTAISLVSPADAMWRRAAHEFTPSGPLGVQLTPFTPISVPSAAMIVWTLAFVLVTLLIAIRTFRRRPL
ncbi:MAG TPA: ABC transporter permease [Gammaproteobacteria bacterium]|nr:ABC transporter permease [Gammaproteobacteria bacterium]